MGDVVVLEIPARLDLLELVRMVVTTAASIEPTFDDDRIEDLRLVVSEACANAIEAHTSQERDERIVLRCDLADDRIEIEVRDRAGGFDPDPELPTVTDAARLGYERGFGIPLMRKLSDEAEFTSSETGTSVRLVLYAGHAVGD